MNLCFRLYTAVNKPECRYGKVKIFTVPVALSQRKFFAERCFINLNDPDAMNLGARRFTISTVGIVPMIEKFASEKSQVNLAVSLHAANDELRNSLIPANRKYPLEDIFSACRTYVETTGRRITFEWALIQGINDRPEDARQLAWRVKGLNCHVNIIPLNPTGQFNGKPTTNERAQEFKRSLEISGVNCTIRLRRGIDIQAGCGQLAARHQST